MLDFLPYSGDDMQTYTVSPEEFTLAFSVIDRNEVKVSPEDLENYIGFFYIVLDKNALKPEENYIFVPAVKC